MTSHSTTSNPSTWRGSAPRLTGSCSSSFRQGTWMMSFIRPATVARDLHGAGGLTRARRVPGAAPWVVATVGQWQSEETANRSPCPAPPRCSPWPACARSPSSARSRSAWPSSTASTAASPSGSPSRWPWWQGSSSGGFAPTGLARDRAGMAVTALALVLAAAWFLPGAPYALGDKDPGVYVNHSMAIERDGSTQVDDAVLERIDPDQVVQITARRTVPRALDLARRSPPRSCRSSTTCGRPCRPWAWTSRARRGPSTWRPCWAPWPSSCSAWRSAPRSTGRRAPSPGWRPVRSSPPT